MSSAAELVDTGHIDAKATVVRGARIGVITAAGVVLFVLATGAMAAGVLRSILLSVLVLVFGTLIAFLPAQWVAPQDADGVARASLIGFVGTVVFTLIDVAILRVINLYPWTWDAIGGGSGWWYLSVWWMLGTLIPWTGSMISAIGFSRGGGGIVNLGLGAFLGTATLAAIGVLAGVLPFGPVLVGGSFVVTLIGWSIVRLVRNRGVA